MASSSDPRELTPAEDQAMKAALQHAVDHPGQQSYGEWMFRAGLAARASSPAPDAEQDEIELERMDVEKQAAELTTDEERAFEAAYLRFYRHEAACMFGWSAAKRYFQGRLAAVASSPVPEGPRLRRTVVHVEGVENGVNGPMARCTASGVDLRWSGRVWGGGGGACTAAMRSACSMARASVVT